MPYITSIERLAKEEGLEQGLEQGLKRGIGAVLRVRFGEVGNRILLEIEPVNDCSLLETILEQAGVVASPEELRILWQ